MAVSESCVNALSHDACIAVICRDSFGFVWLLRPVSAAINIVGKEIDAPTSNSRNIVTVVAKICCEVWIFLIFGWNLDSRSAKVIERTCGNMVRILFFDSSLASLFPPFSMAFGVLLSSLSQKISNYYKKIPELADSIRSGHFRTTLTFYW